LAFEPTVQSKVTNDLKQILATICLVTVMGLGLSAQAKADTTYSVRYGDSLGNIARRYGLSIDELVKANPAMAESTRFQMGVTLVIPGSGAVQASEPGEVAEAPLPSSVVLDNASITRAGAFRRRQSMTSRHGKLLSGVYIAAHSLIGTPYVFGGTSSRGIDCSAFVMRVFGLNGIKLPRTADVQYKMGTRVPRGHESAGDLVFFSTYCAGASHVGIYLGAGEFIHASSSRGVTISNLNDSYFRGKYLGAKRIF
jgi:LysM repeat protein